MSWSSEVTGANLFDDHLLTLINDIGLQLRSNAHTLALRCIRQGPFTLDMALLRKHWSLEPILNNIAECKPLVGETQHEHASLTKLDTYQQERRQEDSDKSDCKRLEQSKRVQMSTRMMNEFEENEDYKNYLKNLKTLQG